MARFRFTNNRASVSPEAATIWRSGSDQNCFEMIKQEPDHLWAVASCHRCSSSITTRTRALTPTPEPTTESGQAGLAEPPWCATALGHGCGARAPGLRDPWRRLGKSGDSVPTIGRPPKQSCIREQAWKGGAFIAWVAWYVIPSSYRNFTGHEP